MDQIHIIVYGKVQGVHFRLNTEKQANKYNLTGRVWNNHNGTVEIIAQGKRENLEQLLDWCKKGEGIAKVEKVEYEFIPIVEKYDSFEKVLYR